MYGGYSRRIEKSDRWTLEEPDEIQAVLIVLEVLAFGRRALRRRNGSLHTPRNHRFIENGALPSLTELTVEILLKMLPRTGSAFSTQTSSSAKAPVHSRFRITTKDTLSTDRGWDNTEDARSSICRQEWDKRFAFEWADVSKRAGSSGTWELLVVHS